MGFGIGSIVAGAAASLLGGNKSKPKAAAATKPATTTPTGTPTPPSDKYLAFLSGNANSQFATTTLAQSNQSQGTVLGLSTQASILAGERSQMTTYVILGVVMLGVAGLVALSRR